MTALLDYEALTEAEAAARTGAMSRAIQSRGFTSCDRGVELSKAIECKGDEFLKPVHEMERRVANSAST